MRFSKTSKIMLLVILLQLLALPVCFADDDTENDKHGVLLSYSYPMPFRIYLPAGYREAERLPVLYLLHGQGQSEYLWEHIGIAEALDDLIDSESVPPMIVVMPRETYYYQDMDESDYPVSVVDSLIPLIDKTFKTDNSRCARAIGGISRGALWAQKIAFEHMDMFIAAGAHSLPNPFFSDYMLNKYIKQHGGYYVPELYIDTGNMDPYAKGSSAFSAQLFNLNINHVLVVSEGTHDEAYWSGHIQEYLLWYGSCFREIAPEKCF